MRKLALLLVAGLTVAIPGQQESFHRAEQDREISYWLLEPSTHQFRISHDFTVSRAGQKYVHSFVRKGSVVSPDAAMFDLDTGTRLKTYTVPGKDVNALGYYPDKVDPDSIAVQGDLLHPVAEGQSTRIRVEETYTDPIGYTLKDGELVWIRTLGRPLNFVTLPAGWMLVSVNTPAAISLDEEERIKLRFTNTRNGDLAIEIRARKRERSGSQVFKRFVLDYNEGQRVLLRFSAAESFHKQYRADYDRPQDNHRSKAFLKYVVRLRDRGPLT